MTAVKFRYQPGDRPFIQDALTRANRSVRRVVIVRQHGLGGRLQYWVVPNGARDVEPVLIAEESLSPHPRSFVVSPCHSVNWDGLLVQLKENEDGQGQRQ